MADDWDLRTTFKEGCFFKIEEKNGKLWTAKIERVELDRVHFTDRDGNPVGLPRDAIKAYRLLQGGRHV